MISREQHDKAVREAIRSLGEAGIILTPEETERIEVADFGLNDLDNIGLQILVYINTSRVCAKELVMTPWQTCPEHRHPAVGDMPGKEETFRCRAGVVYLYVPGEASKAPQTQGLARYAPYLTASHEVVLRPGEQYVLAPDTPHWFRAGPTGAIVSEFSSPSTDENDIFADPRIVRAPEVAE